MLKLTFWHFDSSLRFEGFVAQNDDCRKLQYLLLYSRVQQLFLNLDSRIQNLARALEYLIYENQTPGSRFCK